MVWPFIPHIPVFRRYCIIRSRLLDRCVFDPGDINEDGIVSLLDIGGFIDLILTDSFLCQGDFNGDGAVDLLDVQGMIDVLSG